MRCGWCGRFITADTPGTPGVNVRGESLVQYLCPDCRPHLLDLSQRNRAQIAVLERAAGGTEEDAR